MDGYYEEIINEIKKYIADNNYEEAKILLDDELKMPYIPKEYEDQIIELYNEVRSYFLRNDKNIKYNLNDIDELLCGDLDKQLIAVDLLKDSNIRKYLAEVEKYLSDKPHYLIRSLLIEIMIDQQISDFIHMKYDELDIDFMPNQIEHPLQSDEFNICVNNIRDLVENEDPILCNMCIDSLIKEVYLKLPFSIVEDEINDLYLSVVQYVYKANDALEQFNELIMKKSLALSSDFDLLLYRYNI